MFVTFEGIEGCGKSTQMDRLVRRMAIDGMPVLQTFEPGGTVIGQKIRQILLDSGNDALTPLAELLLYLADRAQHVEEVVKPALKQGKWVLCDRFLDATVVYQGWARGQDMNLIQLLNQKAAQGIRPDITFLLDCPAEIGLERALKRNAKASHDGQDRFEREKMDFHRAVREGYLETARREKERFVLIDAAMSEDEVEREIFLKMEPLFRRGNI